MPYYYRAVLQYCGAQYFGGQKQRAYNNTIQGQLELALSKLCQCEPAQIHTLLSGRTDTAVHAKELWMRLDLPLSLPIRAIVEGTNHFLPPDIRLIEVQEVEKDYHPRKECQSKTYRYFFTNERKVASAFSPHLVTNVSFPLDFALMQRGCELFVGTHDFCNFYNQGSVVSSTVRTISECHLSCLFAHQRDPFSQIINPYDLHCLTITGNGFLKQMVRLIMGHIWDLGRKRLTLEEVQKALHSPPHPQNRKLAKVASGRGLYLYQLNKSSSSILSN